MAVLDDELLQDAQLDAEAIAFVRQQLPIELKEKFDDDDLYYLHDLFEDYLAESGILDSEADDDGYVNIDIEEIASYIVKQASKEGVGPYEFDDVLLVADAEMTFIGEFED